MSDRLIGIIIILGGLFYLIVVPKIYKAYTKYVDNVDLVKIYGAGVMALIVGITYLIK